MGRYNGRQVTADLEELQFDSEGRLKITESNIDVSEFSGFPIVNSELKNSNIDVAGNSVSLGSSTTVDYTDLNDTGNSFPITNSDLANSNIDVAGNSVSLGSSTTVDYTDLNDTGNSFPITNSDLANSNIDVAGNSVSLGSSTELASTDLSDSNSIDAQTLQGNQPSDLQVDPDGSTIVKNSNGELSAVEPIIVGDFESSFGDWTKEGETSSIFRDDTYSDRGSYSVSIDRPDSPSYIKLSTSSGSLKYWFKDEFSYQNPDIVTYVDGNEVKRQSLNGDGSTYIHDLDVTGSNSVKIGVEGDGQIFIDNIKVLKVIDRQVSVSSEAGN